MNENTHYDLIFKELKTKVYKHANLKFRLEDNGSAVVVSYIPRIELFYMNSRATLIFLAIDGRRNLEDMLDYFNKKYTRHKMLDDIVRTIRYLEARGAIELVNN